MTTATMSYIFSPLSAWFSSFERMLNVVGHSRAAAELTRQGYHEQAKQVMLNLEQYK